MDLSFENLTFLALIGQDTQSVAASAASAVSPASKADSVIPPTNTTKAEA